VPWELLLGILRDELKEKNEILKKKDEQLLEMVAEKDEQLLEMVAEKDEQLQEASNKMMEMVAETAGLRADREKLLVEWSALRNVKDLRGALGTWINFRSAGMAY
jgi:DNA anti-recombination protein RmuC